MKKFLFLIVAVAIVFSASAQEKAYWGVRAGMNISNMRAVVDGDSETADSRFGYHVGVSYNLPLVSKLFLEAGLNATTRGSRGEESEDNVSEMLKFNTLYLQVPVAISWHFDINKFSIQPFVGAYYGYGIHGSLKSSANDKSIDLFKKSTVMNEEVPAMMKRSDVGLRFGANFAFNQRYMLGVGYDLGLMNIVEDSQSEGGKFTNGNLFISLGYNF